MSELERFIQELCPNGVNYKKLTECCILEKGCTPIQKAIPGAYPLVVTTKERKSCDTYQFDKATVCIPLVSSRGHGVASLNSLYYQEGKFALGNILCGVTPINDNELSAKFLFYYLNHKKDTIIVPLMRGGANVSLTVNSLSNVKVPIPPISVQNEVVCILDKFEALANELTAELTARKKQYEYCREELLTGMKNSKTISLGEITEFIRNGYNYKADGDRTKEFKLSRIETISTGEINMEKVGSSDQINERYLMEEGDILFSHINSLPYLGNTAYYTLNFGVLYHGMNLLCFRAKTEIILSRYLFYVLRSRYIRKKVERFAKQSCNQYSLTTSDIKSWKIPVPSIEEQERIVEILDRFDALCNDISTGLPAEIEARQKQYGYYRDKLLNFER